MFAGAASRTDAIGFHVKLRDALVLYCFLSSNFALRRSTLDVYLGGVRVAQPDCRGTRPMSKGNGLDGGRRNSSGLEGVRGAGVKRLATSVRGAGVQDCLTDKKTPLPRILP